jgi:hypothetical protein
MLKLLIFVAGKKGVRDHHYSHILLKMSPNKVSGSCRADFSMEFLSGYISRLVMYEAQEQVVAGFKKFALENDDPDSAKFRGNIYEHMIHLRFKNSTLPARVSGKCLDSGSIFEIVFRPNIKIASPFHKLEDIELTLDQALYVFPYSKTNGAYDSFLWDGIDTFYVFQITIASEHSILNHCVKKFYEWIQKHNLSNLKFKFVFVVPSAKIGAWTKPQPLKNSKGLEYGKDGCMMKFEQYIVSLDL